MKVGRFPFILLPLVLVSCTISPRSSSSSTAPSSSQISSESSSYSSSSVDDKGYHKQDISEAPLNFFKLGKFNNDPVLPSVGNVKCLVVPIEFGDYPFTENNLSDIETAIAGSSEETHYWESLKSFYAKSSYGRLSMDFVFSDPYQMNYLSIQSWYNAHKYEYTDERQDETYEDYPEKLPQLALEGAIKAYKEKTHDDCKQFDMDGDGFIDAVIMIYSQDHSTGKGSGYDRIAWAYQYSDQRQIKGNIASPVGSRYFWASKDFFYDHITQGQGVDSHTLIHEMGHIFGAEDYYNYGQGIDEIAQPAGGAIMMDQNICDHDIFTKLAYGWVDPYVVTGDCTLEIEPSSTKGDAIILGSDWNGTCYDEFIIMELYSPTGLNEKDAKAPYGGHKGPNDFGVRMYHVDNRLQKGREFDEIGRLSGTDLLTDQEIVDWEKTAKKYGNTVYVLPAITNTIQYDSALVEGQGYELLQLIQAGKTNTTRTGASMSEHDLFKTNDEFTLATYSEFFPNRTTFNCGDALPFSVHFDEVTANKATISFTKSA